MDFAGVVDAVAALKGAGNEPERHLAASWLWELADDDAANRGAIREAGGIPPLVALIWFGCANVKYLATGALGSLANSNAENKVAIRQAGGLGALVALLKSGSTIDDGIVKTAAANALRRLSHNNDENAVAIALARGRVDAFVELARRGRVFIRRGKVVDNAGAAAKRKAALVVAALLRDFPVPRDMKAVIASYL